MDYGNAMQQRRKDRLASLLSGLAMAVLLGTLLGIPFWLLGLFRIIRISGYWRAATTCGAAAC
jgi:hypothetical protein